MQELISCKRKLLNLVLILKFSKLIINNNNEGDMMLGGGSGETIE